jgi:Zn finger protein HypA/HybF involved in hydrogenase expression
MSRPALEVADIFRGRGPAWRRANAGHVSLGQLKVMAAIERCRTAALGGHVARCEDCAHTVIAYNSCRNRHCPKCQGVAAKRWLADREAELLPVPYYHLVFTLPAPIGDIAYQNKAAIYDILFKASAETVMTIAADPKHLGASVGITAVLHTWGSAMTHHPHVHMIVPGGGISLDGKRWIAFMAPLRQTEWVVYAKRPFGGPQAVLAYLSRYTHRVAIANSRLLSLDDKSVTFKWKDYRGKGSNRYKAMTLAIDEFIRRFLIHVLPKGFHRIRHYGLFAKPSCADNIIRARQLLAAAQDESPSVDAKKVEHINCCPCCGGRMIIIERFKRGATPRHQPTAPTIPIRIDTS